MDLVGLKVTHTMHGEGVIKEHVDNYIFVEFASKTSKFPYPGAFEKFLKLDREDVQQMIMDNINDAKMAAEQKRIAEEVARKAAEEQRRAAIVAATSKVKKEKTIDEMFAQDYHAEKLARHPILNYREVEEQFGIHISGFGRGINPTDSTVVLISSIGKAKGNFVYHDKWTVEGDYIYSGEGKVGDQTMTKGNLAIKDAARDGKKIHLFVKFSPQEYYYQGIFDLVGYTHEDEEDEEGNIRKEYKFRLKKAII